MTHEEVRETLARLIEERREDFAGLSRLLGRNAAYVQQYIRRGTPRKLAEEDRRKLADYFGIPEHQLGGRAGAPGAESDDLITIPRYSISASAGAGAFAADEQGAAEVGFSRNFLGRISGSRPQDLSIIRIEGDSMAPTLNDGDDIMVDRSAAQRRLQDGIYVLRRDDTLLVKRVTVNPVTAKLTIASDNAAYATWQDCDPAEVNIIGRVIWAGRRLR